jgi:HSP20 family protein
MNIVRWNSLRDMDLLQTQLNRLFDSTLQGWPSDTNDTRSWVPPADVYETDNHLVVMADLPGIDPKKLEVRVENNVLTIRGERPFAEKPKNENFHRIERVYGSFARSFTLSTAVDSDKVLATYNSGVLTISLPKAEQAKPKRIEITSGKGTAIAAA